MTPDELRAIITASGLSVAGWARCLGVTTPTVYLWLRGGNIPACRVDWLKRLQDVRVGKRTTNLRLRNK